jgi:hypothetical protein
MAAQQGSSNDSYVSQTGGQQIAIYQNGSR